MSGAGLNGEARRLRLALIDPRALLRTAIAHLLEMWAPASEAAGIFQVRPFSDVAEFRTRHLECAEEFDVVALNVGSGSLSDQRIVADIRALRKQLSNAPLVLISDGLQSTAAFELLRDGLNGYIPATLSPPVTIEALRLVWAGGTFIPPDMLGHAAAENRLGVPPADLDFNLPIALTVRQHAVLGRIRQGKSNKSIGAELGISEGTVKVYVRQIMKKLGASNRTHACYLVERALPAPLAH